MWGACFYFPRVWTITGIGQADKPFLDLRNILSAGESAQHGLDPYLHNPYDPYNRRHGYTDWLLVTGTMGITMADTIWVGTLLIGLTLVSTVLLVRPADWREGRLLILFLVSPPLVMAINRANHDLLVYVIMCVALACFRVERGPFRWLGVVLLAACAALKYFPLAAGILLFEARTRRGLLGLGLLYGVVLLLAWPALERGLHNAFLHQPAPSWLYAFGAPVIFRDFDLIAPIGWLRAGMLILAGAASWTALKAGATTATEGVARNHEREFACGAVMVVGCFLHGSSYIYKMVFAAWLLPSLWRSMPTKREDRWRKTTLGLLLAVLWLEGIMAILINVFVFAGVLKLAAADILLKLTLVSSQLLSYALVLCLFRSLLLYLAQQAQRLAGPAPLPSPISATASDA